MSMAYEKQTWVDRVTPLDAEHMNHIEDGIAELVGIESIAQTTTSTSDGGTNVITATLSNGTTAKFNIKNGSKGSTGGKGDTGATGAAGVGIKTVTQTTTSNADGGENVITVTKTDGSTSTFTVKNGSKGGKGDTGATGAAGYTPVKFVDYYTPADQESIVQQVIAALGTPVFGTVDENKHITLSGHLVDGTYTLSFEDTDGFTADVGTINKTSGPSYTNRLPLAITSDKTPFNGGQGWKTGYRLNSKGAEASLSGNEVIGFIPAKAGDTVYLQNVALNPTNPGMDAGQMYAWCYDANFTPLAYFSAYNVTTGTINKDFQCDINGNIMQFVVSTNFFYYPYNSGSVANTAYIRFNCADISSNSIITVNEPIE